MTDQIKHISEEHIAQAAELISQGRKSEIDADILAHIHDCSQCSEELMSIMEFIDELPVEEELPETKSISLIYWFGVAVAALVILGFVIFPYLSPKVEEGEKLLAQENIEQKEERVIIVEETNKPETIKAPIETPTENIEENLPINEDFEAQILESQSAYRGEDFKLVSPYFLTSSKHQKIEWQSSDEEFYIEWWNVDAELIEEQSTSHKNMEFPQLTKGTYYFKLLNADYDLLAVGRLQVQ